MFYFLFGLSYSLYVNKRIYAAENSYILMNKQVQYEKISDQNSLSYKSSMLLIMQKHTIIVKVHFGDRISIVFGYFMS